MELTTLDRELLDGLSVLTNQEIGRVQAHLAAGLPMRRNFGWDFTQPLQAACFGCLVGVSFSPSSYHSLPKAGRQNELSDLACYTFPQWVDGRFCESGRWDAAISRPTLDRLAALLDMEWSRRNPLPAECKEVVPQTLQTEYDSSPSLLKEAVHA